MLKVCLVEAVVVYGLGFLALAPLLGCRLKTLLLAPLGSYGLLAALGTVYGLLSVPGNPVTMVFVPAALLGVLLAARCARGSEDTRPSLRRPEGRDLAPWIIAALYGACGLVVTWRVLFAPMAGAYDLIQGYDGVYHVNLVHAMAASGDLSSVSQGIYRAAGEGTVLQGAPSFYPAAWHVVATLAMELVGTDVVAATNGSILFVCGLVLPLSTLVFFERLYGRRPRLLAMGCLVPVMFAAFPVSCVVGGTWYPVVLSMALLPAAVAVAMAFVDDLTGAETATDGTPRADSRFLAGRGTGLGTLSVLLAIVFVTLALSQTSAVFALGVFGVSYACFSLFQAARRREAAVVAACAVVLWAVCYKLPFLQSLVHYQWDAFASPEQAMANLLLLSPSAADVAQPLLGAAVALGLVVCLAERRFRWLVAPYAIFAAGYVATASSEGLLKHLLSGFWYTEPLRMGALVVVASMAVVPVFLDRAWSVLVGRREFGRVARWASSLALAGLFSAMVLAPAVAVYGAGDHVGAFGYWEDRVARATVQNLDRVLPADERAFAARVKAEVGDAVVLNVPDDGSCLLYGLDDLDVLWKRDSDAHPELREHLDRYAADPEVQRAVAETGAHYVLQLDQGNLDGAGMYHTYRHDNWAGIDAVGPTTPGFTEVLSEGDMRLYRIEALD